MKIFSASQIRDWDSFTIQHEPVSGIDLMERAATACFNWIKKTFNNKDSFTIICGRGNNGGDGLAIARMLHEQDFKTAVFVIDGQKYGSADFETNLLRLKDISTVHLLRSVTDMPVLKKGMIVIDALFGTGLHQSVEGLPADICNYINSSGATVVSIDVPSGLFTDKSSANNIIIRANYTLTFQQTRLAFLLPQNAGYTGEVMVLPIGLSEDFYNQNESDYNYLTRDIILSIYKTRNPNSHKGTYGHALIAAGSYGMMGASVLAVAAALRSGAGKVTAAIPERGYEIIQISIPEAVVKICGKKNINELDDLAPYNSIGIGPGLGRSTKHVELLSKLFKEYKKPLVIDADALNTMAEATSLLQHVPLNSILTPHPKEFKGLFGSAGDDFEQLEMAISNALKFKIFIILKGHHTFIACPDGKGYFNSTGNAGMATGGSGDVLTGILTGLLAQGYPSFEACLLGVYIHGLAGDIAAAQLSEEALIASDIISYLGQAFLKIQKP